MAVSSFRGSRRTSTTRFMSSCLVAASLLAAAEVETPEEWMETLSRTRFLWPEVVSNKMAGTGREVPQMRMSVTGRSKCSCTTADTQDGQRDVSRLGDD